MTEYKEFNKKDVGKYTIEVRLSAMGYKGPVIFEQEYPANSNPIILEKIADEILTKEMKKRKLEHGLVYKIYQNVPVIEKRQIAGKSASSIK